ncbi:MAG: CBS domain-containing protein [Proteobacteria bacterium]|nr:CBS domain-containing protein [Pseudomonadota bacterium]
MKVTYAVRNIMTKDIISVEANANVSDALNLMVEKDIGSVVVTRDGKMVGIVTERDVLKKCCPMAQCDVMKAGDIMTSPLITLGAEAAIGEAADLMAEKKIRRLVVTEDGKFKGIITERDVMRATLDVFKTLSEAFV